MRQTKKKGAIEALSLLRDSAVCPVADLWVLATWGRLWKWILQHLIQAMGEMLDFFGIIFPSFFSLKNTPWWTSHKMWTGIYDTNILESKTFPLRVVAEYPPHHAASLFGVLHYRWVGEIKVSMWCMACDCSQGGNSHSALPSAPQPCGRTWSSKSCPGLRRSRTGSQLLCWTCVAQAEFQNFSKPQWLYLQSGIIATLQKV